ncbi:MAG: hypothetical protein M3N50_08450 [Pseudomonadota bacterium]|nr:hypothetical protein [Pseudomonadota bacterium]
MNFRKISLLAVSIAALAPAVSNASAEKSALNACAQAFATSLASHGAAAPSYKVAYSDSDYSGSTLEFYNREFDFEMRALDPKTRSLIARAQCSVDLRGNVVAFSSIPLPAVQPATLASRF